MGITIDLDKCTRDALCVLACPAQIITLSGEGGAPAPVEGFEELCISCGHCLAVCPTGALSWKGMGPNQCAPLEGELPSPAQLTRLIKGRRSIRRYKDQPLEPSTIERLLELARYAPSGHNAQPVNWLVISGRKQLDELSAIVADWMRYMIKEHPEVAEPMHMDRVVAAWDQGKDRILRGAPHLVLAYAEEANPFAATACTIALTYLELAASGLGLGACWAGYLNRASNLFPPMQKALDLPEGMASFGALMLGVPGFGYQRVPPRNPVRVTWR